MRNKVFGFLTPLIVFTSVACTEDGRSKEYIESLAIEALNKANRCDERISELESEIEDLESKISDVDSRVDLVEIYGR